MADLGEIESAIGGLSVEADKPIWKRIFQGLVGYIAFGPVDATQGKRKSTNLSGHLYGPITTHATANTEFSFAHEFGRAPYGALAFLPLDQVNAEIVPLTVSRAADAKRVYLKSPTASATIFLYVEG